MLDTFIFTVGGLCLFSLAVSFIFNFHKKIIFIPTIIISCLIAAKSIQMINEPAIACSGFNCSSSSHIFEWILLSFSLAIWLAGLYMAYLHFGNKKHNE